MSAAINAAAFALIDAGIIMNGLPISITCAVMPTQSPNEVLNLTMDPTLEEEKVGHFSTCDNFTRRQVLYVHLGSVCQRIRN